MAEGDTSKGPSFSRLVFGRAIRDTFRFLGYTRRDLVLGAIALILGAMCAYVFVGKANTMSELASIAAFTLAPGGMILFSVFVWHLWLAPNVLAYEAAHAALRRAPAIVGDQYSALAAPPKPAVNWAIWKQRDQYNLVELASLLAKADPAVPKKKGEGNAEAEGYLRLLKEDSITRKLSTLMDSRAEHYYKPDHWPTYFRVKKEVALEWAQSRNFDLSHIA